MSIKEARVIVVIEGGNVQAIISDAPGVEVLVKDLDYDGADPSEVTLDSEGGECIYLGHGEAGQNAEYVAAEFAAAARDEKAMEAEDDPPEPDGHRVIHRSEGHTQEDGSILVDNWTNDNGETGHPGEVASWQSKLRNREDFLNVHGTCRTGCMGAQVIVVLDGVVLGKEVR